MQLRCHAARRRSGQLTFAALAVLALLVIKILFHAGNFGWGFYANLILAVVLAYGAFGISRSVSAAPPHVAAHGS